jgi:DNA-binding XRE family transcriptional regulator
MIAYYQLKDHFPIVEHKPCDIISLAYLGGEVMTFAESLRRLRIDRFLSQRELARRAGLHPVTLTRLEAGATAPSSWSVRTLASTLGVEPRDLTTPDEVAELRRVLSNSGAVETDGDNHA